MTVYLVNTYNIYIYSGPDIGCFKIPVKYSWHVPGGPPADVWCSMYLHGLSLGVWVPKKGAYCGVKPLVGHRVPR